MKTLFVLMLKSVPCCITARTDGPFAHVDDVWSMTGVGVRAWTFAAGLETEMKIGLFGALCALALAAVGAGCGPGDTKPPTSSGTAGGGGEAGTGGMAGMGGGGMGGGTGGAGGSMLVLRDIEVTVEYAGVQTGTLTVAAFKQFPPAGPPVAFVQDPMPMFPATKTLKDVEAGDVYFVAILDIGNNNPVSPGPEDLQTVTMNAMMMPAPVTIDNMSPMPVTQTLTLVDKVP